VYELISHITNPAFRQSNGFQRKTACDTNIDHDICFIRLNVIKDRHSETVNNLQAANGRRVQLPGFRQDCGKRLKRLALLLVYFLPFLTPFTVDAASCMIMTHS
jgi:hypothetical protein